MFGSPIYYNKSKIDQYSEIIGGKKVNDIMENQFDNEKHITNYMLNCMEFEMLLSQRDDYINYVDGENDIPINDVRISSIIKASADIYIPEQFDMVHLLEEYKDLFIRDGIEEKDQELFNLLMNNKKSKIPIYCELNSNCDYWLGIGKINQEDLLIDYNDLEDYEGKEITLIAKLESRKFYRDKPLTVYDIYKDFFGLSRTLRKQIISDKKNNYESISIDEDYLGLELLAMYI